MLHLNQLPSPHFTNIRSVIWLPFPRPTQLAFLSARQLPTEVPETTKQFQKIKLIIFCCCRIRAERTTALYESKNLTKVLGVGVAVMSLLGNLILLMSSMFSIALTEVQGYKIKNSNLISNARCCDKISTPLPRLGSGTFRKIVFQNLKYVENSQTKELLGMLIASFSCA